MISCLFDYIANTKVSIIQKFKTKKDFVKQILNKKFTKIENPMFIYPNSIKRKIEIFTLCFSGLQRTLRIDSISKVGHGVLGIPVVLRETGLPGAGRVPPATQTRPPPVSKSLHTRMRLLPHRLLLSQTYLLIFLLLHQQRPASRVALVGFEGRIEEGSNS